MDEAEVAASIVAGDHAGLAEALDRYSASLFSFCRTMLPAPEAADAVENTFVIARVRLDGLRDPGRLEEWLRAVARGDCFRRLAAAGDAAPAFISEVRDEPVPAGLRGRILKVCTEDTATARAHRTSVTHQAGPFGHDGFPKPASTWQTARFGRRTKVSVAAAVAVLAIAATTVALVRVGSSPPRLRTGALTAGGLPAGTPVTTDGAPADSATTTAAATRPAPDPKARASLRVAALTPPSPAVAPASVPEPAAGAPTSPPAAPSPAPRHTASAPSQPASGTLQLSATVLDLISINNRPVTATVTLTAAGGPVAAYSMTVSGPAAENILISPRSGSLATGQQVVLLVLAHGRSSFTDYLTISPGNQVIVIHLRAKR